MHPLGQLAPAKAKTRWGGDVIIVRGEIVEVASGEWPHSAAPPWDSLDVASFEAPSFEASLPRLFTSLAFSFR